jgi:hypothetical protein
LSEGDYAQAFIIANQARANQISTIVQDAVSHPCRHCKDAQFFCDQAQIKVTDDATEEELHLSLVITLFRKGEKATAVKASFVNDDSLLNAKKAPEYERLQAISTSLDQQYAAAAQVIQVGKAPPVQPLNIPNFNPVQPLAGNAAAVNREVNVDRQNMNANVAAYNANVIAAGAERYGPRGVSRNVNDVGQYAGLLAPYAKAVPAGGAAAPGAAPAKGAGKKGGKGAKGKGKKGP